MVSCDETGHWQRLTTLLPLLQADNESSLHLVHTLEDAVREEVVDPAGAPYGEVQEELRARLSRQLHEQGRQLFPHADRLAVHVSSGVPEEMMLQVAQKEAADIITVGVRHSGKVGRWIAGSTTEALLTKFVKMIIIG